MASGAVQLDRLPSPTTTELAAWLRSHEVHVLHVIGHGDFDEGQQEGVLYFCDEYGRSVAVPPAVLGPYLHDHDPLRLVFLNACQSGRLGAADPFSGMAQRLVQQDCTAVVAMQFPISDGAATAFTGEFYAALADGMPVDQAVTSARKGLLAGYASEWATPVLYLNAPDGQVFDGVAPRTPEATGIPAPAVPAPALAPPAPPRPRQPFAGSGQPAGSRTSHRDRCGRRGRPRRGGRVRGDPGRVERVARGRTGRRFHPVGGRQDADRLSGRRRAARGGDGHRDLPPGGGSAVLGPPAGDRTEHRRTR